jgi:hypothetical protein
MNMTKETAASVRALAFTAPGVGYNYWDLDGTKSEIRPEPMGFTFGKAQGLGPMVALALVREAACRGKEFSLWMCCACGDKETSKALGDMVSHGYCKSCAAKLMADVMASKTKS